MSKAPTVFSNYHPSYWLAALGAGGLSVSFFMYLMWMIPHHGYPMPTWEHLKHAWETTTASGMPMAPIILIGSVGVFSLAGLHFWLLIWNIRQLKHPLNKYALTNLRQSPAELQFMAIPLTLAMTVNVCFALAALFVPNIWSVVEFLFPFALLAFSAIGWYALKVYGSYMGRMLINGGYRIEEHNNLSGLIAVFTFAMLSVGFAAPAAMSHVKTIAAVAASLSILFFVLAVIVGLIVLVTGVTAMMTHGLQAQSAPSIWMLIPILTLLGIEWVRMQHGLSHHFSGETTKASTFVTLTGIFVLQIAVMLFGVKVMRKNGYLQQHLFGYSANPTSFGLICPGVALFVLGMFWWHLGWVDTGLIDKFGFIYWSVIFLLASTQLLTLAAFLRLVWNFLIKHKTSSNNINF